jgi:LPXTG-site transpeptidase (sortase) family protein
VVRTSLLTIAILALVFGANLLILSGMHHRAAQTQLFAHYRNSLAQGVAPTGPVDSSGHLLRPGTPIAILEIPRLHVHEVVLEGTSPAVLMSGPGHLRTTVFPGQPGTSVIYGRAAAYGGPFRGIGGLRPGDIIKTTTGIGQSTFSVIDHRRGGDPIPPQLASGGSHLTLVTAAGIPFMPNGLLWVDASLKGSPEPSSPAGVSSVPPMERALGRDTGNLWILVLYLELVTVVIVAAVFCWRRWGRPQTWIVFFPVLLLLAFEVSTQINRMLPNLM